MYKTVSPEGLLKESIKQSSFHGLQHTVYNARHRHNSRKGYCFKYTDRLYCLRTDKGRDGIILPHAVLLVVSVLIIIIMAQQLGPCPHE